MRETEEEQLFELHQQRVAVPFGGDVESLFESNVDEEYEYEYNDSDDSS